MIYHILRIAWTAVAFIAIVAAMDKISDPQKPGGLMVIAIVAGLMVIGWKPNSNKEK